MPPPFEDCSCELSWCFVVSSSSEELLVEAEELELSEVEPRLRPPSSIGLEKATLGPVAEIP